MAKTPVGQTPEATLISSAVRSRKPHDVGAESPASAFGSRRQLTDGATGIASPLQAPVTRRQRGLVSISTIVGAPMQPAGLPGVPTPCQPPCLTPVRQRNAAMDGTNAPAFPLVEIAALTVAAGPAASTPEASPPTNPRISLVHSSAAIPKEVESPITARVRPRNAALSKAAASAAATAAAVRSPKPTQPARDTRAPISNHLSKTRVGSLPAPSAHVAPSVLQALHPTDTGGGLIPNPCALDTHCAAESHGHRSDSVEVVEGGENPSAEIQHSGKENGQVGDGVDSGAQAVGGARLTRSSSAALPTATLFSPVFFGGLAAHENTSDGTMRSIPAEPQAGGGNSRQGNTVHVKAGSQKEAVQSPGEDEVHSDNDVYSENDTQIRVHCAHTTCSQGSASSRADAESEPLDERSLLAEEDMDDVELASPQAGSSGALKPILVAYAAPAEGDDAEEEEDYEEFDPYLFIRRLPPLSSVVPPTRTMLLPRQTRACKRKTLVLDLDETLVHSSLDGFDLPDFSFPVFFNNREHMVAVRQRPHLSSFLERVAELFEVVIFTASQKVYAEQLLNVLDPERRLIRHRVFRDSCVFVDGNYLKDLSVLGRDLRHTVIIDNSPQAFGFQLANGIPIESWYDDESDEELLRMLPFLESLVSADDVRPLVSRAYGLHQRVAQARDIEEPPRA